MRKFSALEKAQGHLIRQAVERQSKQDSLRVKFAKKTLKAAGIVISSLPIDNRLVLIKVAPEGYMPNDDWMQDLRGLLIKQAKLWSKKYKIPYEECDTTIISVAMSDKMWSITSTPRMFITNEDLKTMGLKRIKK